MTSHQDIIRRSACRMPASDWSKAWLMASFSSSSAAQGRDPHCGTTQRMSACRKPASNWSKAWLIALLLGLPGLHRDSRCAAQVAAHQRLQDARQRLDKGKTASDRCLACLSCAAQRLSLRCTTFSARGLAGCLPATGQRRGSSPHSAPAARLPQTC